MHAIYAIVISSSLNYPVMFPEHYNSLQECQIALLAKGDIKASCKQIGIVPGAKKKR